MKHNRLLLLIIAALVMLSATASMASLPKSLFPILNFPNIQQFDLVQFAPFAMKQGWENGRLVWFICTDTNDLQTACNTIPFVPKKNTEVEFEDGINFAPRLGSAAGHVATVFIINNNVTQGPVFTAVPGDPTYSGIWQAVYVCFKPGATKHCVNNADPFDPVHNPNGLPSTDDATFTTTNKAGIPVIIKYPIMAVGPLGGPWIPAIPGEYRIPQGRVENDYTRTKIIFLPFWQVFCRNSVTKAVTVRRIIIPDVFDVTGALTAKIGANNAPGLAAFPPSDEQAFYFQTGKQPIDQFPILQACTENQFFFSKKDEFSPCKNSNFAYTPVDFIVQAQRNVPPLPVSTVITNEPTLLQLAAAGCLTLTRTDVIIDAPILPPEEEECVVKH